MNLQTFIRLFLVAALCISQLAAQAHIVSHFKPDVHAAHHCDSASHDAECLLGQMAHHDSHHNENPESQSIHGDCAIYHSYLSLSWCSYSISKVPSDPVQNSAITPFNSLIISQQETFNYAIRAPPLKA